MRNSVMNAILGSMLLLSACASVTDMKASGPSDTFNSVKEPGKFTICLSEAWQSHNKIVNVTPIENGQRVNMINNQTLSPIAFADVLASEGGTHVLLYQGSGMTGWSRDDVVKCL